MIKTEIADHVDIIDGTNDRLDKLNSETSQLVKANNTVVKQLNEVQDNVIQNSNQLNEVQENVNELKQFKETFGNVEELVNSMKAIASNNKKKIKK